MLVSQDFINGALQLSDVGSDIFSNVAGDLIGKLHTQRRRLIFYDGKTGLKVRRRPVVEIGKVFDNRDHSTVLYSLKQVEKQMKKDPAFAETVKEIKTNINNRH